MQHQKPSSDRPTNMTNDGFERLLIFDRSLPDLGGGLDENASLEELSEHILFYHDSLHLSASRMEGQGPNVTNNAVQFASVCAALLSLPEALSDTEKGGSMEEFYLENATLVFCAIEELENPNILAVAQISPGSGNALAVANSLQKSHQMFRLLRGGGIHHRLSRVNHVSSIKRRSRVSEHDLLARYDAHDFHETPVDISVVQDDIDQNKPSLRENPNEQGLVWLDDLWQDGCQYPGMKFLYGLRKTARKLTRKLSRVSEIMKVKRAGLQKEIDETASKIRVVTDVLPIGNLRRDLHDHYSEYLSGVFASVGTSYRCVIECLPQQVPSFPLPPPMSIECTSKDDRPSMIATMRLGQAIQKLLQEKASNGENAPQLLGVSTFFKNNLVSTHMASRRGQPPLLDLHVSNATAHGIFGYMSSFRVRMLMQQQSNRSDVLKSPSRRQSASKPNNQTPRTRKRSIKHHTGGVMTEQDDLEQACEGNFLEPPPLAMLNISDRICEVDSASRGRVWTPVIHMPIEASGKRGCVEINVALLAMEDFSLLLYTNNLTNDAQSNGVGGIQPDPSGEAASLDNLRAAAFLDGMAADLSACVARVADFAETDKPRAIFGESPRKGVEKGDDEVLWTKNFSGLDIVFVDRSLEQLVVVTGHDSVSAPTGKRSQRIKGMGKKHASKTDQPGGHEIDGFPFLYDCRHALASRLPVDVLDAFDDMMTQIHRRTLKSDKNGVGASLYNNNNNNNTKDDGYTELCTYLSSGWMWACAHHEHELYILFEPSRHVTIKDVQRKAQEVRGTFLF